MLTVEMLFLILHAASLQIEDCRTRYNGDADHHQHHKKFTFPACLICGDCYEVRLDKALADDAPFDICSCQLKAYPLEIVSTGYDLKKNFRKRNFSLQAPLVSSTSFIWRMLLIALNGSSPFHVFKSLVEEYDMELIFVKNS